MLSEYSIKYPYLINLLLWNCTAGAFIGGPCALVYTLCIAYVSYVRVYHLFMPLTLIIDCVTFCRLLEYIYLAATIPRFVILYYAFFLLLIPSLWLILYLYNTVGVAKSSVFISNLYTIIVRQYFLLATMLSLKSNPIPWPNLRRQSILGEFNLLTLVLTPKGKSSGLKEL
jgi:hypothetical protein